MTYQHGLYKSNLLHGYYYVAHRSSKDNHSYIWYKLPFALDRETVIAADKVPPEIRDQAYKRLNK